MQMNKTLFFDMCMDTQLYAYNRSTVVFIEKVTFVLMYDQCNNFNQFISICLHYVIIQCAIKTNKAISKLS